MKTKTSKTIFFEILFLQTESSLNLPPTVEQTSSIPFSMKYSSGKPKPCNHVSYTVMEEKDNYIIV